MALGIALLAVAAALAIAYVVLRVMEALEIRALKSEVAERYEELRSYRAAGVDLDAEAAALSAVSHWLDQLGHDPNRAEIRRFAAATARRPPAKVRHAGRVTHRG